MPREAKGAQTRKHLVEVAGAALIEGGGDFEMNQLARSAGVSDGLPYHYFGSKAGALCAVIDDFYDRYYSVVNQKLDGSAPWAEREFERLRAWVGFLYEEPLAPIVLGKMGRTVQVARVEVSRQEQLIELARRNIEIGQQTGEIPETLDASIAAAAIIGAIRQAASQAVRDVEQPEQGVVTSQLWALISGALSLCTPNREHERA